MRKERHTDTSLSFFPLMSTILHFLEPFPSLPILTQARSRHLAGFVPGLSMPACHLRLCLRSRNQIKRHMNTMFFSQCLSGVGLKGGRVELPTSALQWTVSFFHFCACWHFLLSVTAGSWKKPSCADCWVWAQKKCLVNTAFSWHRCFCLYSVRFKKQLSSYGTKWRPSDY